MENNDKNFTGSIPEFYDTYLVPLIFEEFADDLATRIMVESPNSILEIAAGSGVVPRALGAKIAADVKYTITDLNQPMLDYAKQKQPKNPNISWQQADVMALPFEDNAFDAVVCQFGFMFFPDKIAAMKEVKRVLKPNGELIFNVWDCIENNVFADLVTQAASQIHPENPPLFLERTPHGFYDNDAMRKTLQDAGFKSIIIQDKVAMSTAPSALHAAKAYCHGTPLRNELEALGEGSLDQVTQAAADWIAKFYGKAEVAAQIQGFVITAS
ncbi:MAG: SAM-dependent methyltransferase [Hyphomicrobiales bacterium]|nr:MAG: SAM-dependent methyltransferase [Hyphomicrobiales bacterium]